MTEGRNSRKILFLSVGGSDNPLRSSLREVRPDHVVFVVSDGIGGSISSRGQAESLYDTEGCPEGRDFVNVPPDDPDVALARIEPKLTQWVAEGADVVVDYTGGTKSMTSAMVLAATSLEGVRLQFMAGVRPDLNQVEDGTEKPLEIPTGLIGLSQTFRTVHEFIGRRNYGAALSVLREAGTTFQDLGRRVPRPWRRKVDRWQKWVEIFDEWDRFNHRTAWRKLQNCLVSDQAHATWFEGEGCEFHARLRDLADTDKSLSYEFLEDLWLNAQRRAALGLYDDAIARLYRLMEACVQTRLWIGHEMDTSAVPVNCLPECLQEKHRPKDGSANVQLPLMDSVRLLEIIDPSDQLPETMKKTPPQWRSARNNSILAHGFRPLAQSDWKAACSWFEKGSEVLWKRHLGRASSGQLPNQLPGF